MELKLSCPSGPNDTGAFRLTWSGPEAGAQDLEYTLEETEPRGATTVVYEGPHVATTVSGRPEGTYAYRVGRAGSWSETCRVQVEPPSMSTALTFFGFGLLVVTSTVLLVVRGHLAHRKGLIS